MGTLPFAQTDTLEAVSVRTQQVNTVWSLKSTHNPPVNAWFDDWGEQCAAATKSNRTSMQNTPLRGNEKCQNCIKENEFLLVREKPWKLMIPIKLFSEMTNIYLDNIHIYEYWLSVRCCSKTFAEISVLNKLFSCHDFWKKTLFFSFSTAFFGAFSGLCWVPSSLIISERKQTSPQLISPELTPD